MSKCSASAQHKGEQTPNPSIFHLPSSHYANDSYSPPATASGLRRVGEVANELLAEWGPARIDTLAARIAANQVEQLDQLSLTGWPGLADPAYRAVVETSLRLTARRILEEVMDA